MKHHLFLFFLLCLIGYHSHAQLIDSAHIDFTPYKGKLIVLNEAHSVKTNNDVYNSIVHIIAGQLEKGDSINIIIEWPYSTSVMLNKTISRNDTSQQYNYYGLPVRFIGVDFERLYKKENNTYIPYLSDLIDKLSNNNIPVSKDLKEYLDLAKTHMVVLKDNFRKPIISFYKKEREKLTPSSVSYRVITELLFLLTANHKQLPNLKKRDALNYKRLMEADKNGLVSFRNNYNILIHGTCHTDPAMKKGIYNRFLESSDSPFKDNTFFIGQAYIECISARDYFRSTPVVMTHSIFCDDIFTVTDYFKNKYKGKLSENSVIALKPDNSIPDIAAYKGKIIGWYLHWKVGAEK